MMHEQDDFNLPPRLVEDLRDLQARRLFVPGQVDEAVRAAAAAKLSPLAERQRWRFRVYGAVGVAAAAAIAVGVFFAQPADPYDIDRSGGVDILDAFALARSMDRDINGDGVIDQADVDAIAHRAVQLPEEAG